MHTEGLMGASLQLIGAFLVLVLLVYPWVLSGANRLINGFWPRYWRSLVVVVLVGIVATIVTAVVGLVLGKASAQEHQWLLRGIALVVTALAGGGILKGFVRHADGEPLRYGRALLASLLFGIVVVLIGVAMTPWQKGLTEKIQAAATSASGQVSSAASTESNAEPALATSTPASAGVAEASSVAKPSTSAVPARAGTAPASAASTD